MARLKAKFLACLLLAGYCLSLQQYDGLDRKKRSSSSSSSSPAAQSAQSVHPELAVRHSHRPAEEDVSSREKKKGKAKGGEHMDLDPFEGARLAEGALRIFARTAKLTADALRVVGDTAAGVGGSGVKVVGSAVKSVGSVIENSADEAMRRNDDEGGSKFAHVTRKVAGHGVKVMSTMVKGVGESFLLVGQATGEGFILYAMRVFFCFFFYFSPPRSSAASVVRVRHGRNGRCRGRHGARGRGAPRNVRGPHEPLCCLLPPLVVVFALFLVLLRLGFF